MTLKYLLDENINPSYRSQFRTRYPELVMWVIGDPGTPPQGTLDPEILIWCEAHDFVLVTNNRRSMPVHLADHIAQGQHVPGILILNPKMGVGETLDELAFIAELALEDEYQDQIVHLPVSK
jgi:hypothetical protein